LLLVVTFLSCEEEPHLELDSPETITEVPRSSFNSRSYVNMDDIPEVIGSLEKRMGSKVSKSGLGLGNKISAKDYEVFLDSIAQVVNEGSNTNYTFALDVKGAGPNEFYNLVVGKTPDGEIKDPIVVRYALEQEDMDYFMNGGTDLKRLNAKYSYYNFERFFDENLKMTASGNEGCGSGYIGGGSGGGPMVPPGGSIQTSGFGVTVTTNFQTGHVTTVPYDFNISVTDENGNTEVNSGQAYSQNLDGVFATNYGQQDIDPIVLPPETATFNQDNKATQDQNGTINLGCTSSSHLDGAGWHINGCEESGTGQHNKGSVTAKEGDCEIPEGTMATLTTFTLMILNKTSGYIGLNLANPVDWSRYLWLSHRVIPVCIPINQFVEGEGQSNEAKNLVAAAQLKMMQENMINYNPLVKYPENSTYETDYPRLTEYLKNELPNIADNQIVVNLIHDYTDTPKETIKEALQWGKGPEIVITDLDGDKVGSYRGFFDSSELNKLYLDTGLVLALENAPSIEASSALSFFIAITILHEYSHLGDTVYGDSFWGNGWLDCGFCDENEVGKLFEGELFDEEIWWDNYEIIFKRTGGF